MPPGGFGDQLLERLVEVGHCRLRAIDVTVAENRAARTVAESIKIRIASYLSQAA